MRSHWLADAAPPTLGAVAEGAWIAVFGAAIVAPLVVPGAVPDDAWQLLPYLAAALLGAIAARRLPMGAARPAALFALVAIVVLLAVAGHRTLWQGAIGSAPTDSAQPIAVDILLGLAVLRGAVQGDPGAGADAIDTLVRRSPLLLTAGWLLGLAVAGDGRASFATSAGLATGVFLIAAALALGAARLATLTPAMRDERGNGAWLVLVAVVVGCAFAAGIPLALILGRPLGAITGGIVGLAITGVILVAGGVVGVLVLVADVLVGVLRSLLPGVSTTASPPLSRTVPPPQPVPVGGDPSLDILEPIVTVALVIGLITLAWYLAHRWQGRHPGSGQGAEVTERRSIVLDARATLPSVRLRRRRRPLAGPDGALEAYPRLLDDWSSMPAQARRPTETPAAHAARLRADGAGAAALDLLVADFQLARFGAVRLTPAEDRRAVRRYHRLRGGTLAASGPVARDP